MIIEYFIISIFVCVLLLYAYKLYRFEKIYIDLWLYNQIMFFFPYFILYPFAGDLEQQMSVGNHIYSIRNYLPQAFVCNCIGFVSLWIGKYLYDANHKTIKLSKLDNIVYTVLYSNIFKYFFLLYVPFIGIVVYIALKYNDSIIEHLRSGLLSTCFNIAISGLTISLTVNLINYIVKREKKCLIIYFILLSISLISGRRALIFGSIFAVLLMHFIYKGLKLKIRYVIILIIIVLNLAFFISAYRSGSINNISLVDNILYGNTFCDVRDFAWILSGFDDNYLFGKTYISGIMSFIPSSFSEFRNTYSWGKISLVFAGLENDGVHYGLRGGIFCEPYLNFSYLGIILLGCIHGYVTEWCSTQHRFFCKKKLYSYAHSCTLKNMFTNLFMISAGFWKIYAIIVPIIILYKFFSKKRLNYSTC